MKPLKLGLKGLKVDGLKLLLASLKKAAEEDADLADPPVTAVELGTASTELNTANTEAALAKDNLKTRRETLKEKTAAARKAIRLFGVYAYAQYKGDKVKLNAIGLDVADLAGEPGPLPAPTNLRSRPGDVNQAITLLWNPVKNRESHQLECAESADGPWTEVYRGKKCRAVCSNLTSGKLYYFRVRAYGQLGWGAWSDITASRAM